MFRRYRGWGRGMRYHSHGSRRGLTYVAATAAGPCGIWASSVRTKRLPGPNFPTAFYSQPRTGRHTVAHGA